MKRIVLVLTAALILAAMTVVAVPAMAQETKVETTMEDKGKEKDKSKMKEDEKKDLPQSGGVSIDTSLLGLAAGTLLVGGGLVARRATVKGSKTTPSTPVSRT